MSKEPSPVPKVRRPERRRRPSASILARPPNASMCLATSVSASVAARACGAAMIIEKATKKGSVRMPPPSPISVAAGATLKRSLFEHLHLGAIVDTGQDVADQADDQTGDQRR